MRKYRQVAATNSYITGLGSGQSQQFVPPDFWNDSGIYTYFYMDFRKAVKPFSLGMLLESIQVLPAAGTTPIPITKFQKVATGIYKIFCNYTGQLGLVIVNRDDGWIYFESGAKVPAFSESFEIAGPAPVVKVAYIYDLVEIVPDMEMNANETTTINFNSDSLYTQFESISIGDFNIINHTENVTISFWAIAP